MSSLLFLVVSDENNGWCPTSVDEIGFPYFISYGMFWGGSQHINADTGTNKLLEGEGDPQSFLVFKCIHIHKHLRILKTIEFVLIWSRKSSVEPILGYLLLTAAYSSDSNRARQISNLFDCRSTQVVRIVFLWSALSGWIAD